jgi:hypothetical protein
MSIIFGALLGQRVLGGIPGAIVGGALFAGVVASGGWWLLFNATRLNGRFKGTGFLLLIVIAAIVTAPLVVLYSDDVPVIQWVRSILGF